MKNNEKFNIILEQYLLNENSQKNNVEFDEDSLEYIKFAKKDNELFFNKFNINTLINETKSKSQKDKKIYQFPNKIISGVFAIAVSLIIIFNVLHINTNNEVLYLKGIQSINIYLKSDNSIKKLTNMNTVSENNQIQLTYLSIQKYGLIFSIDGLNNVTFHLPQTKDNSLSLEIGKEVQLPTSYIFDNAPFFEKFYFVTSNNLFTFDSIKSAINKIKIKDGIIVNDLKLPKDFIISTTVLIKE